MSEHRPPDTIPAEVDIDAALVRRLLRRQRPDLAEAPVTPLAVGWDNALFRVGPDLIARMPRRALGATNLAVEARWLAVLAPSLPLPIPTPRWVGEPDDGYPYPWSLVPWLDGTVAGHAEALDLPALADALGAFFGALHRLPLPADAPHNPFRGVTLSTRDDSLRQRLHTISDEVDAARLVTLWEAAVAAPGWSGPLSWCHGDPHPFNLLTRAGRLAAVLDWGDLHGGEPAPDLACVWMLLPPTLHARFRAAHGPLDDATWARGLGWGIYYGVTLLDAGRAGAGQAFARVGRTTLAHVLATEAG